MSTIYAPTSTMPPPLSSPRRLRCALLAMIRACGRCLLTGQAGWLLVAEEWLTVAQEASGLDHAIGEIRRVTDRRDEQGGAP